MYDPCLDGREMARLRFVVWNPITDETMIQRIENPPQQRSLFIRQGVIVGMFPFGLN